VSNWATGKKMFDQNPIKALILLLTQVSEEFAGYFLP
jgi:hypothetical protein